MTNETELPQDASVETIRAHILQRLQGGGILTEELHDLLEQLGKATQREERANGEFLEALHLFQYGTQEESDQGFTTLKSLAQEG